MQESFTDIWGGTEQVKGRSLELGSINLCCHPGFLKIPSWTLSLKNRPITLRVTTKLSQQDSFSESLKCQVTALFFNFYQGFYKALRTVLSTW